MKNILITGGAGFIGSELGKFLLNKNYNVQILDNLEYGYKDNFEDNLQLKNNFIHADIRSKDINKYLENIDVVVHFAGISALPECEANPQKAFEVNTAAVANILDAIRESNVKKFIFSSTSAVYEMNDSSNPFCEDDLVHPNLIYASSKYFAEQICKSYVRNYDMDITICRFFNVFGPHQDFKRKYPPFTSYLIKECLAERKPTIYNISDVKRDYIYVDDLMQYLFLIITSEKKYKAEIFNLSSGYGYSALEIADIIFKALDKKLEYKKGDPDKFWDKYEDLFNKNYNLNTERVKKELYKHSIGNNNKVIKKFGYIPSCNLATGIQNIINYQRSYANKG